MLPPDMLFQLISIPRRIRLRCHAFDISLFIALRFAQHRSRFFSHCHDAFSRSRFRRRRRRWLLPGATRAAIRAAGSSWPFRFRRMPPAASPPYASRMPPFASAFFRRAASLSEACCCMPPPVGSTAPPAAASPVFANYARFYATSQMPLTSVLPPNAYLLHFSIDHHLPHQIFLPLVFA